MGQEVYRRGNGGTLMKKMQERSQSRNRNYPSIMERLRPHYSTLLLPKTEPIPDEMAGLGLVG